jgi:hypothetical protein
MSEASPVNSGLLSGLLNTTGQVGGAMGLAILATVAATRSAALGASGYGTVAALAGGYHTAWLLAVGMVAVAVGITALALQPRRASVHGKATVALAEAA